MGHNIVICVVLFAILMGIAHLFNSEGVAAVMIIVWFVLIGIVNFVINHYFAYLVKAGHVAVIAQTFKEGRVPDNCVPVGKAMVKMMHGYMQVAPSTVITYDLYTQLSGLSSSFKRLFNESRVTPETVTAHS